MTKSRDISSASRKKAKKQAEPNGQSQQTARKSRKGSRRLGELIGQSLTPLCRKQGFASADIVQFWAEIVGPQFANCTEPDKIRWPRRGQGDGFHPGTLVVHCEGAQSLFFHHESVNIIQRVNAYFGYPAIDKIQILQRPVRPRRAIQPPPLRAMTKQEEQSLDQQLKGVNNDRMAAALKRLGHAIAVKG
ncbi:MAG: DciA family protein [Cohaesibacter sp.]|nr:DciA family protein [Cohaesibacter sp.]